VMAFTWPDVLRLAQGLAGNGDEASLRSAMSRAYYSAFNHARQWLTAQGVHVPTTGRAHQVVWNELENHGHAVPATIGRTLRTTRNRADYDDVLPFDPVGQAQLAIAQAQQIIAAL